MVFHCPLTLMSIRTYEPLVFASSFKVQIKILLYFCFSLTLIPDEQCFNRKHTKRGRFVSPEFDGLKHKLRYPTISQIILLSYYQGIFKGYFLTLCHIYHNVLFSLLFYFQYNENYNTIDFYCYK